MRGEVAAEQAIEGLLARVDVVSSIPQYRQLMRSLAQPDRPVVLSFVNQHALDLAWGDAAFRLALDQSDFLLRDGVGVAALMKMLGIEAGFNLNGTDLIPEIVRLYAGRRVAVIGTAAPFLERACQQLEALGAQVVFSRDGFTEENHYLAELAAAEPALVILGMGMPKQERFAAVLQSSLRHPALIVNGGAILDFLAGRFPRAPRWLRRLRLEWLYRLLREPGRLWRRYVVGGVRFTLRGLRMGWRSEASRQAMRPGHFSPAAAAQDEPLPSDGELQADERGMVQLWQRVQSSLPAEGSAIVQFMAARPSDGGGAMALAYAQACADLRSRRVLLVSDRAEGHAPCLQDVAQREVADGSRSEGGLTVARPSPERTSAGAVLGEAARWVALRQRFDDIVIDVEGAIGLLAAPHADGVVIVVRAESTPATAVRQVLDDLETANATVIGAVLDRHYSHLPRALRDRV
ncbi:MAG TPA: WecB/TagA/CpsF family glycosyltransferase [Stenotrophomonas sp.]|jgi:exopolysaccharide biosynthesis WecB/TagA/CpsF family protein